MEQLSPGEITVMFCALGILLAAARLLGEIARRLHQPEVLGELLAGILLGPTILGIIAPDAVAYLFPLEGKNALVLDGLTTLAITLFMLVAGMEVELSAIWRQGKAATTVGLSGIVFPFGLGLVVALLAPNFVGGEPGRDPVIYALFFATALSISALPVIAKTLMDLRIYRSDFGMIVIAAAVLNDLVGWIIFAVILGMIGMSAGHESGIGYAITLTLLFATFMLTSVRWFIHRILPWLQAHTSWPGGVLSFALTLTFLCAAFTEWIGIHAIFGAFLAGVALGDTRHLREHTRTIIDRFVSFIFAPLFFASIGLKLNFAQHFDGMLVGAVLLVATIGKVLGCTLGARLGNVGWREAWGLGFALNARGTMEIILGLLALQFGLIHERMFVALVIMAIVTSLLSGPMLQRILQRKRIWLLADHLNSRAFVLRLTAETKAAAIGELSGVAAAAAGLDAGEIKRAVISRELAMPTGLDQGIAVPHARLAALSVPLVCVGIAPAGIDFDAPDATMSQIVFLILTPEEDDGAQLEILADVARVFGNAGTREHALKAASFTEFLALARTG
jgi:Kef-type K+ transport system membrane component KefB/mannitol/fructose-specific phosphotransferase system IIA component